MRKLNLFLVFVFIFCFLASNAQAKVSSNIKADPTSDLIKRLLVEVERPLSELKSVTNAIWKAESDYKINPVHLIAILEEQTHNFKGFPEGHIYQYNLDTGLLIPHDRVTSLPAAYSDVDRIARNVSSQIESFNGDLESGVAAYFFGISHVKEQGLENLSEDKIQTLQNITDFIADHPDDRPGKRPISTSTQRVTKNKNQPQIYEPSSQKQYDFFGSANSGNSKESQSIQEKYIKVMRHFNKKLDEKTAKEIYWAIAYMAQEYPDVDARLVMALFAIESAFKPDAVSRVGAQGLGQLMPFTSDNLNVDNPFDASENVKGTFMYLDREFDRWKGKRYPLDLVLASYNAGAGAVEKYNNDIPPYKETQEYVKKVINIYTQLLSAEEAEKKLLHKTRYYHRGHVVRR